MWTIFEGLLEPRGVECIETPEARAQRLKQERVTEARRLAEAERKIQLYDACIKSVNSVQQEELVTPTPDEEGLYFEEMGDGTYRVMGDGTDDGTYRTPPKSDVELLRQEVDDLRKLLKREITVKRSMIVYEFVTGTAAVAFLVYHLMIHLP